AEGVASPEHDQLRVAERLRVHPDPIVAERVPGADAARDRADGHPMLRGAERVPEPAPAAVAAMDEPHAARAEIGPDRLGADLADDAAEPLGDLVEGLVPGDALEGSGALGSASAHRVQQTIRRLAVGDVVVDLVAQDAARERMRRIALEADGPTVLHRDNPAA